MKLTIKNHIFYYLVLDENNKVVAKIKNKCLWGVSKKVLDSSGQVVYTTDIVNLPISYTAWHYADSRHYVIYHDQKKVAEATFKYAKNPERNISQKLFLKPPQITEMTLETPYGSLMIMRQKDNTLLIDQNGISIGSISNFFTAKKHFISCKKISDKAFLAAVYVISMYMIHEENLIAL